MAWARWMVCQASYWRSPYSEPFSLGCQPMAVGKKSDLGALERGDARALRVPLRPSRRACRWGRRRSSWAWKAQVAGGEVKLLVVERIVGDVHLAIDRCDVVGLVGCVIENGGSVVVQPRCAALEEARNHHEVVFADDLAQRSGGRAGDGLGCCEAGVVFARAEVLRAEELRQAEQFSPAKRGFADASDGFVEVRLGVG